MQPLCVVAGHMMMMSILSIFQPQWGLHGTDKFQFCTWSAILGENSWHSIEIPRMPHILNTESNTIPVTTSAHFYLIELGQLIFNY